MYKNIWSGFKFGTILQVAIGPICLFIFQTAASGGFAAGESAAFGVALGDVIYVLAAIWGVGAFLERNEKAKLWFRYFGAAVLAVFGLATILGVFGMNFIPGFSVSATSGGSFTQALFLTLSSPLTIIFWAGVFSSKIADGSMTRNGIYFFGLGAVLSTIFFMSLTVLAGLLTNSFMPPVVIDALNLVVGAVLILFGAKSALGK